MKPYEVKKPETNLVNKADIKMHEQDNLLEEAMRLMGWDTVKALEWYTRKSHYFDNMAPIDFVESGYGWRVLNHVWSLHCLQAFKKGFDEGVARGVEEERERRAIEDRR